ncbi:MAG TPA: alpha/beta hydrolase [Actinophytocola sp.]|uniref:alpha/beta hydrolase n=1 Tax=Actinophytocola sp. TaxID=1872138 RepID=UPI002DDD78B8|nr:alpha/beta hydrolase [Actinophytocola sp.]HEV2780193.1 alpha/beta hydrolase [Actinophytocola sp.]
MRRRGMSLLAASVAAVGLLAGCTAGPSDRPEIVVNDGPGGSPGTPGDAPTPAVPPLEEPQRASIRWNTCPDNVLARIEQPPLPAGLGVQCGRVRSTMDSPYAPGRGFINVQVLKVGTGPIPLVVVNDVGGQPGMVYAARLATTLPRDFFQRFSLVGVDRRGTGNTEPPDCVPPEIRVEIVGTDPTGTDADDWLDPAKTAGQQCQIELESKLPALDTWRTAVDLDTLRQALGLPRLHAIGHGEGSRVLTVYADRFPDRVGRFVLDGLPDAAQDAVIGLEDVAAGAQATWQAFAEDCVNRGCELGADPHQALPALLTQLRAQPLSAPNGIRVGPGVAVRAVLVGLADRRAWPALSAAIDAARRGAGGGLGALIAPVVLGTDGQSPTFDNELVVGCNDTRTRLTVEQLNGIARDWTSKYPLFGTVIAHRLALCGVWPVPSTPVPTPTAKGAPPIVVLGTASDPVTPLPGTERAAGQLDNAVVVTWQGGGHGALGYSSCATDAARAFLIDGTVPRHGTACPP